MNGVENIFQVTKIYRLGNEGSLRAFCDIRVAEKIVITGLRIVDGKNGLFVGMPSRQGADGKWHDTVFPADRASRESLQEQVLEAYRENVAVSN